MTTSPGIPQGQLGPSEGDGTAAGAVLEQILDAVTEIRQVLAGTRKDFQSVEEVARLTSRSPYTVRRWIAQGLIRAERVSGTGPKGRLLIPTDQVRKLIVSGKGSAVPAPLGGKRGQGF